MKIQKQEIDWEMELAHLKRIFPEVEADLEERLSFLQTLQPVLSIGKSPPRLISRFIHKNIVKGDLRENKLSWYHEGELRAPELKRPHTQVIGKDARIPEVLDEIAGEYDLIRSGSVFLAVFKPDYSRFTK
jgi:hypothetical protein